MLGATHPRLQQLKHVRCECCGQRHGLHVGLWELPLEPGDVLLEAVTQKLVGLVKHQHPDGVQWHPLGLHQRTQPAGGPHRNLTGPPEPLLVLRDRLTPHERAALEQRSVGSVNQPVHHLTTLKSNLSCRSHNDGLGCERLGNHILQHRNTKHKGFPRPRLCLYNEVSPKTCQRDGFVLHRRRAGVACPLKRYDKVVREEELREGGCISDDFISALAVFMALIRAPLRCLLLLLPLLLTSCGHCVVGTMLQSCGRSDPCQGYRRRFIGTVEGVSV
mmetsp:Transcript_36052/g.102066  ORF Transcript_36052/g.102066 Transcript_36052/m.102066 type:complete len:275 (+) Transcript_36052:1107-1931(+)